MGLILQSYSIWLLKDNENILGARRAHNYLPWIRIDPTAYGCWIVEIAPLI